VAQPPKRLGYPGGGLADEPNYLKLLLAPLGLYRPLSWFKLALAKRAQGQQPAE
jgi:hypothetical protein